MLGSGVMKERDFQKTLPSPPWQERGEGDEANYFGAEAPDAILNQVSRVVLCSSCGEELVPHIAEAFEGLCPACHKVAAQEK